MANEKRVIEIQIDGSTSEISARKLEQSLSRIDRQLDPLGVATKGYNRDLAYLKAGLDSGSLTADQHAQKIAALGRQYDTTKSRLGDLNRQTVESANATKAASANTEQAGVSFGGTATRAMAAAAAVAAAAYAAKEMAEKIATAGDEVRSMSARLNLATGAAQNSRTAFEAVFAIAQRGGVDLKATADAFTRIGLAAKELGASTGTVATVTETFVKLGAVGGASAQEMASGMLQFGQALASGKAQGDELRSMMENMPLVVRAIAKELNVSVGALKQLGAEGKITADVMLRAMVNVTAQANAEFEKLPPTMERAGQRSANAWKLLGSAIDESVGLSRYLAAGMEAATARVEALARRISGDLNQAIRDTNAEIAKLEAAKARSQRDQAALDARGPGSTQTAPFTGARGGPSAAAAAAAREEKKAWDQLGNLEDARRFADEAETAAETDRRIKARQEADARSRQDAATYLRDLKEKADPAAKALREFNAEKTKLDDLLKKKDITPQQYSQGLVSLQQALSKAGGSAKETARSIGELNEALTAQAFSKQLADGAYAGAEALARLEAEAQAAKKALDLFNGKRNASWEARYADSVMADRANKLTRDFRESTLGIERENQLLQRQLELVGQRPEIVDREIALLKVRLDLESRGVSMSEEDVRRRVEAMSIQERLTRETEQSRKAAEMWAEPFKNAIQGIQSTFTDFFEQVISGGIKSFSDLGQSVKRIWFRLMAELASAAIIRPVIQFVGSGLGQLGILGPQTLQSMGITGGSITGGSGGGGLGLGSLLGGGGFSRGGGGGWLSRQLGGIGSWLNTPFSSMGASAGAAGSLGGFGGSLANSSFLGNLTPMNALGAAAGVGSGIFQLATGGGSASSLIGGIGSMIGAGVSLIPGIGQIAGPIIGIASSLLGSLFKSKPQFAAQGFHSYNPATGGYGARVGYETNMKAPLAPGIGNDVLKLLGQFGGSVAPGRLPPEYYLWSGFEDGRMDGTVTAEGSPTYAALLSKVWASGQIKTTDEAQWAARTELWTDSPVNGEWTPLPINSLTTDKDKLAQQVALLILKAGVRDGAFTGLSDTSQKIIRNYPDADTQGLGEALQWGKTTYDQLIRTDTITAAETALTGLRDSFQVAIAKAEEYRLATDGLVAAQSRAINKYATDFQQSIDDRILGINDPAALAQVQLDREFEQIRAEAKYLNEQYALGLTSTLININDIERLYGLERQRIVEQQVSSLVEFERRLRYGDLSTANPLESLSGALGAYQANAAQALAGNTTAIGQYQSLAEVALQAQRNYSGNDYATTALIQRMLGEIALLQGRQYGAPAAANDELLAATLENTRLLREFLDRQQAA